MILKEQNNEKQGYLSHDRSSKCLTNDAWQEANNKLFVSGGSRLRGTLNTMKRTVANRTGPVPSSMGIYSAEVTRVELRESASLIYCNTLSWSYPSGTSVPVCLRCHLFPFIPRYGVSFLHPLHDTGTLLRRNDHAENQLRDTIDTRAVLLCRSRVISPPRLFLYPRFIFSHLVAGRLHGHAILLHACTRNRR